EPTASTRPGRPNTGARSGGAASIQDVTPSVGVQASSAAARPGNSDATPIQTANRTTSFRTTPDYVARIGATRLASREICDFARRSPCGRGFATGAIQLF